MIKGSNISNITVTPESLNYNMRFQSLKFSFEMSTQLPKDSYILILTNSTNNIDCGPDSTSFCNKFWFSIEVSSQCTISNGTYTIGCTVNINDISTIISILAHETFLKGTMYITLSAVTTNKESTFTN